MLLRIQHERQQRSFFPSIGEYVSLFGLNMTRFQACKPGVLIMHPGPINRGVEIASELADGLNSTVLDPGAERPGRAHGRAAPPRRLAARPPGRTHEPPPLRRIPKSSSTVSREGYPKLVLPSTASPLRFAIAAFLLFWLGGWLMGLCAVLRQLIWGHHNPGDLFLLFWLGAWTLGGGFASFFLYRLLRPPVPETLVLTRAGLEYDSGLPPFNPASFSRYRTRVDPWKTAFPRRKIFTFSPDELATLRLRENDDDNRLTIDHGNERIDLGVSLTEVERGMALPAIESRIPDSGLKPTPSQKKNYGH